MEKKYLIGIVAVIIIIGVGSYAIVHKSSSKNISSTNNINQDISNSSKGINIKVTFTNQEQENYYKLSQNVGDIGIPSASMTTNLKQSKIINGIVYYKTYSYDTRSAYGNDTSNSSNNNFSHLISTKIISLDGQSISNSQFGEINKSNLSKTEMETQIAQIAALYVEGYTANNPKIKSGANSNYESNLNEAPSITVNLDNNQNMNNETLYNVNITINNKIIPIYVGLDGYIYISTSNYFNDLFFPNEVN